MQLFRRLRRKARLFPGKFDVSRLRGVSERRTAMLAELGIASVLDLLTTYPRRYIDRTRQADKAMLRGGIGAAAALRLLAGRRTREYQPAEAALTHAAHS